MDNQGGGLLIILSKLIVFNKIMSGLPTRTAITLCVFIFVYILLYQSKKKSSNITYIIHYIKYFSIIILTDVTF